MAISKNGEIACAVRKTMEYYGGCFSAKDLDHGGDQR